MYYNLFYVIIFWVIKMKKTISVILTVLILLSMLLTILVSAKNPVELKLTDVTVYAGDEFEMKLFISDNSQLSGAVIDLQYDATKLEFVSGEAGQIIDKGAMVSINASSKQSINESVRFTYLSPNLAVTSEGILFSVKFKALPNAEGESDIKISIPSAGDFVNADAEKLAYTIKNSTVKIINTTVESTEATESTTDESVTDIVESSSNITESSTADNNIDNNDKDNDYIEIVIGLFIAGGIIIVGVGVYLVIIKRKKR